MIENLLYFNLISINTNWFIAFVSSWFYFPCPEYSILLQDFLTLTELPRPTSFWHWLKILIIKMISLDFHIKWVYWFVLPKKTCICFWMVRTSVWILQWQKFQFTRWSTKNLCTTNILIIRYYSVVLFFHDSRIDKIFTSLNFVIIVKLVYYTSLEFNLHESSYLEFVWIMYYSVRRKL